MMTMPRKLCQPGFALRCPRPGDMPRSPRSVYLSRFQPVWPLRSRQIFRRRLARVIGKGVASGRSGSSAAHVRAWWRR